MIEQLNSYLSQIARHIKTVTFLDPTLAGNTAQVQLVDIESLLAEMKKEVEKKPSPIEVDNGFETSNIWNPVAEIENVINWLRELLEWSKSIYDDIVAFIPELVTGGVVNKTITCIGWFEQALIEVVEKYQNDIPGLEGTEFIAEL